MNLYQRFKKITEILESENEVAGYGYFDMTNGDMNFLKTSLSSIGTFYTVDPEKNFIHIEVRDKMEAQRIKEIIMDKRVGGTIAKDQIQKDKAYVTDQTTAPPTGPRYGNGFNTSSNMFS